MALRRRRILGVLCITAGVVAVWSTTVPAVDPGLPATVTSASFSHANLSFPMVDYGDPARTDDTRAGTTAWRVVSGTGNCCENYLATTPSGRLVDFGGTYLNFSDDEGLTWKRVAATEPFVGGEGAVTYAPGGDIVGVAWDVYSGDHLLSFKYEADTQQWLYNEEPIHVPFFDREWVGVVPGPITVGPLTVPYIVFLRGGYPSKDVWYYSLDGLTYTFLSDRAVEQHATTPAAQFPTLQLDPEADWYQTNTWSRMTPLPARTMLGAPEDYTTVEQGWSLFDSQARTWSQYAPGWLDGEARVVADSEGRLNRVTFDGGLLGYAISSDGGQTWSSTEVDLPANTSADSFDVKVNAQLGFAAVAVHARDSSTSTARDLVYKIDVGTSDPFLSRFFQVGKGDLQTGVGLGSSDPRFDFDTVAILPDGRIVVSFEDSIHQSPAIAIEQSTELPPLA